MLPASNYPPQAPFNRKNKSNTAWAAEKDLEKKVIWINIFYFVITRYYAIFKFVLSLLLLNFINNVLLCFWCVQKVYD